MTVSISIDIKGLEKVALALKDLSNKVLREAYWELYRVSQDTIVPNVKKHIKRIDLWDSGDLYNSIDSTPVGFGKYKNRQILVHDGVPYGKYHELGFHFSKEFAEHAAWGKGMPELEGKYMRNPFLRPGTYKSVPIIRRRLENVIKKNL